MKSFRSEASKFSDRILLSLILGPSDGTLRQCLFDRVRAEPKTFVGANKVIGQSWVTIYARELLSGIAAKSMDDEEKAAAVTAAWSDFVRTDLLSLTEAMVRVAAGASSA